MSENSKVNNENGPICLHCGVHSSKHQYQEIFDEVGVEIELANLLAKYFQVVVKPDAHKPQLLCEECVKTLIRFFDIDELQRQQDAANAAKRAAKKAAKPPEDLPSTVKKVEISAKNVTPTSLPKAKSVASPVKNLPKPETVAATGVATSAAKKSILTVLPKRLPDKDKEVVKRNVKATVKTHGAADQEQISALIRDILDDEEPPTDDKFAEAAATVRQLDKQTSKNQGQQEAVAKQLGQEEEDNNDELEFLLEQDGESWNCSGRLLGVNLDFSLFFSLYIYSRVSIIFL